MFHTVTRIFASKPINKEAKKIVKKRSLYWLLWVRVDIIALYNVSYFCITLKTQNGQKITSTRFQYIVINNNPNISV